MRLAQLDLTRYGHFTDKRVELPEAASDLHLVVGENEAGKSTIRQAILDLFYGIAKSSTYGFKHGLPEMELGGVIEKGDTPLTFRRLKKIKNPLLDGSGNPLSDAELSQWLGGADAAFYERMFGLNHATLVAGAKELLNSKGDAGHMLFQAAAGVTGLHKLRERLEADAYALWGDRKRGDATFYIALQRLNEADARFKEVSVTAGKWQAAKRELDTAEAAATEARTHYAALDRERQRLERVRRVAGVLRQRAQAAIALAELGPPPLLPATAGTTLEAAAKEIAQAEATYALLERRRAEEAETLVKLNVDTAVLDHKAEIENLGGRVSEYLKAVSDLPALQRQIDTKTGAVRSLAGQIGWTETTLADIQMKVPTRAVRSELHALLLNQKTVALTATQVEAERHAKEQTIAALKLKIAEAPGHAPIPAVVAALKQARSLDISQRSEKTGHKVQQARSRVDAVFALLAPWSGDQNGLRDMELPDAGDLQRLAAQRSALETLRSSAAETLRSKRVEAARAKASVDAHCRQHQPVTVEVLTVSRGERDAIWRRVRSGERVPTEVGDAYEHKVRAADYLADRRYLDADTISEGNRLANEHRRLLAEIDVFEDQLHEAEQELTALDTAWTERMQALGLALSVSQLPAWSQCRDKALAAAQGLVEAETEQDDLATTARGCGQALCRALLQAGIGELEDASLAALIACAEALENEQRETHTRIKGWQEQLDEAELTLAALAQKDDTARKGLAEWTAAWKRQLAAAGLAENTRTEATSNALDIFTQIDEACRHVRENAAPRVALMNDEVERFVVSARGLAATCAPGAVALPPTDIAARLRELLREAGKVQQLRMSTETSLGKTRGELEGAEQALVRAEARIKPLLDVAGVESVETLRAAIAAADHYRAVEARITAAEEAARSGGDNLPLDSLQGEVDATDLTQIEVLLKDAQAACKMAEEHRDAGLSRYTQAKGVFEAIGGQDAAIKAKSQRQDALLGMGDAVDEYVRIAVGARLLKWAVGRYSEEQQQPLLKRASGLFDHLTRSRYAKLSVNFEAEPPELLAHRTDGSLVAIGRLSTGAESQLYLALRLAALELHIQTATPLPFIADDLFVDWDDKRAGAGFSALAELATRTQVIVLSHHHHLIEVAQNATAGKINVVVL